MQQQHQNGFQADGFGSFDSPDNVMSRLEMAMLHEVLGLGPNFNQEFADWREPKAALPMAQSRSVQNVPQRMATPLSTAVPSLSLSPLTTPESTSVDQVVDDIEHGPLNQTIDGVDGADDSPLSHRCFWRTNGGVCGHVCSSEKELQGHCFAQHVPERKPAGGFRCCWQRCDRPRPFQQKSKLERHMMTHTCYKPFECTHPGCTIRLSSQQALVQHERTHTGEMPYECDWPGCTQRFKSKSAYTNHTRTHTGEKPLVCEICFQRFSESSNLAKHRKTHHQSEGKHRCGKCGATFERKCALVGHSLRCDGSQGQTAASRRHRKVQSRHAARCQARVAAHHAAACCPDSDTCADDAECQEVCIDTHCPEASCLEEQCIEPPCTQTNCDQTDCTQEDCKTECAQTECAQTDCIQTDCTEPCLDGVCDEAECDDDECNDAECDDAECPNPGMAPASFHACHESSTTTAAMGCHGQQPHRERCHVPPANVCNWMMHDAVSVCHGIEAQGAHVGGHGMEGHQNTHFHCHGMEGNQNAHFHCLWMEGNQHTHFHCHGMEGNQNTHFHCHGMEGNQNTHFHCHGNEGHQNTHVHCHGMGAPPHTHTHNGRDEFDSVALAEILTRLDGPIPQGQFFDDGQFAHFGESMHSHNWECF